MVRSTVVKGKVAHRETQWAKQLPLNKSNPDLLINYIGQSDLTSDGDIKSMFSRVTDQRVTAETVQALALGGRSRWRIENETFNTLKNQGYHFEHNYGHGKQRLSTVLMILMMLAFLVDQVQQACCPLYIAVLAAILSDRCSGRYLPPYRRPVWAHQSGQKPLHHAGASNRCAGAEFSVASKTPLPDFRESNLASNTGLFASVIIVAIKSAHRTTTARRH